MLRIRTLGGVAIETEASEPLGAAVQGRRMALLVLVARASSSGVSRDKLLAYLWPESDAERARSSLRQTLYALRRDLAADELITGTGDRLTLNSGLATVDVEDFSRALAAGELERAIEVYKGPFLDGFHLSGAPEFDRWVEQERAELARQYRGALEKLAERATAGRDYDRAAGLWRRVAATDPLDAGAAVGLMRSLTAAGNTSAALQHARVYEVLAREELGAAPGPRVAKLVEQLRAGVATPDESPRSSGISMPVRPPTPAAVKPPVEAAAATSDRSAPNAARPVAAPEAVRSRRSLRTLVALSLGAAAAWIAAYRGLRDSGWLGTDATNLSPDHIVVAPFNVLSNRPELQFWREGLVDVLSRNLDGAGPLRTIPPSYVIGRTSERSDRATARTLGRNAGARFAVYGNVMAIGADSVRVQTALLDTESDRVLGEADVREHESRIDRLADTLTLRFLRHIGELRPIGAARGHSSSLGARSLPALKLFLQGEQHFRRHALDRSHALYEQAVALDSTFVLALRRAAARWWYRGGSDRLTLHYALRAGALNRGLGPRDSLLVLADSINASLVVDPTRETWLSRARRHLVVLEQVTRLYPDDAESWYQLAHARAQARTLLGIPSEAVLDAARRSVDRDPEFAPAYIIAAEMSLAISSGADARRFLRGYLERNSADRALRLVALLIEPASASSQATQRLIEAQPIDTLRRALGTLEHWQVDSTESALRIARELWRRASRGGADVTSATRRLAYALMARGRLMEAHRLAGHRGTDSEIFRELSLFGLVPSDSANEIYRREVRTGDLDAAIQWWWIRGDSAAVRSVLSASSSVPAWASGALQALRPYLSLTRGDTTRALLQFKEVPDTLCGWCWRARVTYARLLGARGDARQAFSVLTRAAPYMPRWAPSRTLALLEQARAAERFGAHPVAASLYCRVAATWRHADVAVLAGYAGEARRALQRLGAPCSGG